MKEVILSHDSEALLYLVPDQVADQLDRYCWEFAAHWLWQSPHAQKYHKIIGGIDVVCYGAPDFIDYLNEWVFPCQPSVLVRELGCCGEELPKSYEAHPKYNF